MENFRTLVGRDIQQLIINSIKNGSTDVDGDVTINATDDQSALD
jgi:hypothetical protein